jgi:hypothetical protein
MSYCSACERDDVELRDVVLCGADADRLYRLLALTQPISSNSIELKNVRLTTDIPGTPYVVSIDGQGVNGWQQPIGINGAVKCMVCGSLVENNPVCDDCKKAIMAWRLSRSDGTVDTSLMDRVLDFFNNSKLHAFFEMAGEAAFEKWMANELAGMGDREADVEDA